MNCSAYDSSFERPLAVKPSSIIEWMLCQKSWLFIFDTVESLSNDAQKYNIFSKCRHLFVHSLNELGEAPKFRDAKS